MKNLKDTGPYCTKTIRLHPDDNVASALQTLNAGETIQVGDIDGSTVLEVILKENIPLGHKFALYPLHKGSEVRKHGVVIGWATGAIQAGAWISEHNLE